MRCTSEDQLRRASRGKIVSKEAIGMQHATMHEVQGGLVLVACGVKLLVGACGMQICNAGIHAMLNTQEMVPGLFKKAHM